MQRIATDHPHGCQSAVGDGVVGRCVVGVGLAGIVQLGSIGPTGQLVVTVKGVLDSDAAVLRTDQPL